MDSEKRLEMYEEMYDALREAALLAIALIEGEQYKVALRRLEIGMDRAEKIFLQKNVD